HRRTDRTSVGHALGGGDDVRRDFPLLDAEPFLAGASPAGLDFVSDEQSAVILHDLENDLEVFLRRSDEAAESLDRFGDERGDLTRGGRLDHGFYIGRTGDVARRIGLAERTPIAIRIHRVRDAESPR